MNQSNDNNGSEYPWADSYAGFVIRNRWAVIILVLILSILGSLFIKDLDMRNDPDTLLPPSNRYVSTNAYAEQKFGMGNLMVFALKVKEGDIYQPWFINKVQELHERLVELPYARSSNFIDLAAKKIKYMGADENGLVFKRLIPTEGISTDDPEKAKEQLAFLKEGMETNPVLAPMLVGMEDPEGNKCAFADYEAKHCTAKAVYIIGDYTDDVKPIYLSWVRQVRDTMKEFQDDRYDLLVAGEPYFLAYMLLDLANKWWLFAISFLIVLAVLWYEFRNWRGAVFPLVGVGATIAMTLGIMGFSAFKLTTMMVLTPMLLLAIGIGHSVQVTRRFMQEETALGDCTQAARIAIGHTIVPATLSIITDMVGFATLATVDISFYKAYAYFGMFGMATLILTTTTLIPLLMLIFPCGQANQHDEARSWETKVGGAIAGMVGGPGKWLPIGFVALVLAISTWYTKLYEGTSEDLMPGVEKGIDYSRAAFKRSSETITQLLELNKIMPGVISVTIPIRGKHPNAPICVETPFPESLYDIDAGDERQAQCKKYQAELGCWDPDPCGAQGVFNDAAVLGDIEKMENWMRAHPYIGFTGSYAQYIRLVNMLLTAEPGTKPKLSDLRIPTHEYLTSINPDDDRVPSDIVKLYNGLLEIMTEEGDMDAFIAKDWNEGVIMGFINTMNPKQTHKVTVDITDYIEAHKNDTGFSKVNFGFRCEDASCDTGPMAEDGPDYVRPGIGGFLGATEATREVAWDNWLKGPLQTALAVFIIAALIFRSFMVSAILTVLLFITLFAQYGLGGYFTSVKNWSGNLAFHLQVALSIAMGLGIDYGIYMMSRLREEMKATAGNWEQSLLNTLNTTGSAVIISVVVLISCFIPLMNTNLANTWGLGVYITEALVIDVVTALTILPLLVKWLKPKFVFGDH